MKKPQAILATIALLLVIALPAFKQSPSVVLGRTINNLAYQPGETLKYRIHYGAINAGEWVVLRSDWDKRAHDENLFLNANETGPHTPGPTAEVIEYLDTKPSGSQ